MMLALSFTLLVYMLVQLIVITKCMLAFGEVYSGYYYHLIRTLGYMERSVNFLLNSTSRAQGLVERCREMAPHEMGAREG